MGNLYGDISGLTDDVSQLSGDATGVSGSGLTAFGDLDDCEINAAARAAGVTIHDLTIYP